MGTTRIKVIDLSSAQAQIKTSRKHASLASLAKRARLAKRAAEGEPRFQRAEKLAAVTKLKQVAKTKEAKAIKVESPQPIEKSATAKAQETAKKEAARPKHHRGKRYLMSSSAVDKNKNYSWQEAIELLYKTSFTKFDPTVEVHLNVNDKNLRGKVNFPYPFASTKPSKYLIFTSSKPKTKNGHLIIGDDSTISQIESGKLRPSHDFDYVIAQPKFMPQLTKVAKILGPAGMMPNPKNGTVVEDVEKYFEGQKDTAFEFKTDPTAPIIHTKIGKLSAKPVDLEENLQALIAAVGPTKIKKAVLTSTMGPPIKVDISTLSH